MKQCSICKEFKNESCFNKQTSRPDGLQTVCKVCNAVRGKQWYEENRTARRAALARQKEERKKEVREYLNELKSVPCVDCRQRFNPWQMDFDHLSNKKFDVAFGYANGYAFSRIKEEVSKCEVVCANCHRQRTYERHIARSSNGRTRAFEAPRSQFESEAGLTNELPSREDLSG